METPKTDTPKDTTIKANKSLVERFIELFKKKNDCEPILSQIVNNDLERRIEILEKEKD